MLDRLIWFRRINSIHGKDFSHPNSLISKARVELQTFKQIKERHHNLVAVNEESICLWKKPPKGVYKLNRDTGIGAIIKDSYGNVMGTLRAPCLLSAKPFTAEAYALMIATIFCQGMGIKEVIIYGR